MVVLGRGRFPVSTLGDLAFKVPVSTLRHLGFEIKEPDSTVRYLEGLPRAHGEAPRADVVRVKARRGVQPQVVQQPERRRAARDLLSV